MIYMFLANGFEEIEALCPLDLLRRAGLEVMTVGVGTDTVTGAHGISVLSDMPATHYRDSSPEMIILPGGMPGTTNLEGSDTVQAAISAASRKGAYIAAICAAPMVLGKRGILNGKKATCFPGFEQYLEGAVVDTESAVVRDGNIITAAGMGAALEFGLELVAVFKGREYAEELRHAVIADRK